MIGQKKGEPPKFTAKWRGQAFFAAFRALAAASLGVFAIFRSAAARMSPLKAYSLILSPWRKSMARRVPPSRLALKRPDGSGSEAPLAKVVFTQSL
jgi:hypothetical protein